MSKLDIVTEYYGHAAYLMTVFLEAFWKYYVQIAGYIHIYIDTYIFACMYT